MLYTLSANNKEFINIATRAFNLVDPRLIDHGNRVSHIVHQLLQVDGTYSPLEARNLLIIASLHDIGAYKTEEIDRMVEFETKNIWNHSIYGYLFFKFFTPFCDLAPAVLFHHTPWDQLRDIENIPEQIKKGAQLINVADRADIYFENTARNNKNGFLRYLESQQDKKYSRDTVDLFHRIDMDPLMGLYEKVTDKGHGREALDGFGDFLEDIPFTEEDKDSILKMLIYAIDFRSPHTVTHTITTTAISLELATLLCEREEDISDVVCGALIHDLGKIGIPVEILEFPGKLSPQAMKVMRTHVDLTEHIVGESVSREVREIALRHHEKLDGSGYPRGLKGEELDTKQRIVAVADIVSALTGTRSYKEAFAKEKTLAIINDMSDRGFIDSTVVGLMADNFDAVMEMVREKTGPILEIYDQMQGHYQELLGQMKDYIG